MPNWKASHLNGDVPSSFLVVPTPTKNRVGRQKTCEHSLTKNTECCVMEVLEGIKWEGC